MRIDLAARCLLRVCRRRHCWRAATRSCCPASVGNDILPVAFMTGGYCALDCEVLKRLAHTSFSRDLLCLARAAKPLASCPFRLTGRVIWIRERGGRSRRKMICLMSKLRSCEPRFELGFLRLERSRHRCTPYIPIQGAHNCLLRPSRRLAVHLARALRTASHAAPPRASHCTPSRTPQPAHKSQRAPSRALIARPLAPSPVAHAAAPKPTSLRPGAAPRWSPLSAPRAAPTRDPLQATAIVPHRRDRDKPKPQILLQDFGALPIWFGGKLGRFPDFHVRGHLTSGPP